MEGPKHLEEILDHIVRTEEKKMIIREEARKMMEQMRKGDVVCVLNMGLYGLPQAGRAWNDRLDDEPRSLGAVPSETDPCVYVVQASNFTNFIVIDLGDYEYCLGTECTERTII